MQEFMFVLPNDTFSGRSGIQFGLQLVLLFLQLGFLLLQVADGGDESRHIRVLLLLLQLWGHFITSMRFVLICGTSRTMDD